MSVKELICRFCLKIPNTGPVKVDNVTREIFDVLQIRLEFKVNANPVMCKNCSKIVERLLALKSLCVDTEEVILLYYCVRKNSSKVDLRDIYEAIAESVLSRGDDLCRLCMKPSKEADLTSVDVLQSDPVFIDMWEKYMTEVNLNITKNPKFCFRCKENVRCYFKFVSDVEVIEEKISSYRRTLGESDKQIRLNDVKYLSTDKVVAYSNVLLQTCTVKLEDIMQSSTMNSHYDTPQIQIDLDMKEEESYSSEKSQNCPDADIQNDVVEQDPPVIDSNDATLKEEDEIDIEESKIICEESSHDNLSSACYVMLTRLEDSSDKSEAREDQRCTCGNCAKCSAQRQASTSQIVEEDAPRETKIICEESSHDNPSSACYVMLTRLEDSSDKSEAREDQRCTCGNCAKCSAQRQASTSQIVEEDAPRETKIICEETSHNNLSSACYVMLTRLEDSSDKSEAEDQPCTCGNYAKCRAQRQASTSQIVEDDAPKEINNLPSRKRLFVIIPRIPIDEKQHSYRTVKKGRVKTRRNRPKLDLYECPHCAYVTYWKSAINFHIKRHSAATYNCQRCRYTTKNKRNFKNHLYAHENLARRKRHLHKCTLCDFQARCKSTVKEHMQKHKDKSELQVYKCFECDYETFTKRYLRVHVRKHSSYPYFACTVCSFNAATRTMLQRHLLIHKNPAEVQMHVCAICGFKTKYKQSLPAHMWTHMGGEQPKTFKCPECSYRAHRRNSLVRHSVVHKSSAEVTMYRCSQCTFESRHKSSLRKHIMICKR